MSLTEWGQGGTVRAYRNCIAVRLPRLDGMVPLRELS